MVTEEGYSLNEFDIQNQVARKFRIVENEQLGEGVGQVTNIRPTSHNVTMSYCKPTYIKTPTGDSIRKDDPSKTVTIQGPKLLTGK